MRSLKVLLIAALVLGFGAGAYAELQNVEVGGSLRIRGSLYDNDDGLANNGDNSSVEQRTRLNVTADFSDDVSVFVEVDSHNNWGDNTRTVGGAAVAGTGGGTDVNLYQGYIDTSAGDSVQIRIGRQELVFGNEFILGDNSTSSNFVGQSYDGVRLNYSNDVSTIDAFWAKLEESGIGDEFGDNDIDLHGVYASYLGIEDVTIDAYWVWIREDLDAGAGSAPPVTGRGAENDLHTIGLRGAGTFGAIDFDAELAFQSGDVNGGGDFDGIAFTGELGYSLDSSYQPRLYIGYTLLEGSDGGDIGFTRSFSDVEFSQFLGGTSGDLSNLSIIRGGVSLQPSESVSVGLDVSWFEVDEETAGSDENLGVETNLSLGYQYSEDLVFRTGWAHLFADDGVGEANAYAANGVGGVLGNVAGSDEDSDYLYVETEISF